MATRVDRDRERLSADAVVALLSSKYAPPEFAFIPQVRSTTGGYYARTADAVAMSLWPSRGLELLGFEVKVSRSDWKAELRSPEKAEEIARYCDRWWIVAESDVVTEEDGFPATWGLMVVSSGGKQLRVRQPAQKLDAMQVNRRFLASVLRRAQEVVTTEPALKARYDEGFQDGKSEADRLAGRDQSYWKGEVEILQDRIKEFESASGVGIDRWDRGRVGEAVRLVLAGGDHVGALHNIRSIAEKVIRDLNGDLSGGGMPDLKTVADA